MKKQGKRFVAMMAAMFLTQTVCSFPQGIVHAKAQTMEKSQIELSDQDIANLYHNRSLIDIWSLYLIRC